MEIKFIKCSERMPPRGVQPLIVRDIRAKQLFDFPEGTELNRSFNARTCPENYEWIPYDEATWRGCCLPVSPDNKL